MPLNADTSGAKRRRRRLLLTLGVVAVGLAGGLVLWRPRAPRPNIILVTFDTTRADRLGAYGYDQGLTRAFDEFAQQGVLFERAYAPAPITLPSHATMLTGLYPPEHGLRVNGDGQLPSELPLLPEILKEHGYDTAAFIAAPVLAAKYGLARGFDVYDDEMPRLADRFSNPSRDGKVVIDAALRWLKQRQQKPYFCWIHLFDAHGPYDPRTEAYQQRFEQNPYDAGVAWEVEQFGRLTAFLKERRLVADTLVVVAGDHGEGLDDHLEVEHGMLVYNTTLRVPFVFAGQRYCRPGTRVPENVSLVDLLPTLLDLLRIPLPKHVSGRSLAAALKGQTLEPRVCYGEAESPFLLNRWAPLRTVISGRWKYIQTTKPELYDLDQDPDELKNLIESSVTEGKRLQELLASTQEMFVVETAENLTLSEKDLQNLQALGYAAGGKQPAESGSPRDEILPDVKDFLPLLANYERAKHLVHEGMGAQSADELMKAIALLRDIAEATPDFPLAELLLGDCLAQAGQQAEAETVYRAVLSRRPDFLKARFNLGRIYAEQGRYQDAATEFREFLQVNPAAPTAQVELARALTQLKDEAAAIEAYREALRLAPEMTAASLEFGRLLLQLQRPKDAQRCFEDALTHDSRSIDVRAHLMMVLAQTGQNDLAIQQGRQLILLDPQSFDTRFNLGVLLNAQHLYAEGVAQLREAQKLRPHDSRPAEQIQRAEAALRSNRR